MVLAFVVSPLLAPPRRRSLQQQQEALPSSLNVAELIADEVQEQYAEGVVQGISLFGGGILVLAAVLATINLVSSVLNSGFKQICIDMFVPLDFDIGAGPATLTRVRLQLAQLIALGLGVLLISDILETLVKTSDAYDIENLYKLATIAAIRTGLSYFLGLETDEIYEASKADARLDGRDINFQQSLLEETTTND